MKKTASILLLALLCYLPARAQDLALIFESQPGTRPSFISIPDVFNFRDPGLLDADGDGTPDLILTREDDDGNLQGIRVFDMQTQQVLWEMQNVTGTLAERDGMKFVGFVDVWPRFPDVIFASEQDVVLINPGDNSLEWSCSSALIQMGADPNCLLRAVTDLTGDGFAEIIISSFYDNPATQVVMVWSKPDSD